jgi:hypothetical protein
LYSFFVHVRHPSCRLVTRADAPFPDQTRESAWRLTGSRHADDVDAEVREALERDGYSLFRIGLSLAESRTHKTFLRVRFFSAQEPAATSRVFSSIAF